MRKIMALFIACAYLVAAMSVYAEITLDQLDSMNESDRSTLGAEVFIAISAREAGLTNSRYSDVLGIDLADLSIDELKEIRDCLDSISNSEENEKSLSSIGDFLGNFNVCASIMETGHDLSVDNVEVSKFSSFVLLKAIFNKCEILSLRLNKDSNEVMSVQCTYSILVPGASAYADDFIYLLLEAMYASGIGADLIIEALSDTGFLDHYDVGDTGEAIVNGLKIGYEVTSEFGVSFTIEPTD